MAKRGANGKSGRADVDLSESSVHGKETELDSDDAATADRIDRLESIIGGVDEEPLVVEGKLGRQFDALDASTEEELDALKVDLVQDGWTEVMWVDTRGAAASKEEAEALERSDFETMEAIRRRIDEITDERSRMLRCKLSRRRSR